jgi:hypothetical protein
MKHTLLLLSLFISIFTHAQWTSDTTLNTQVRDTANVLSPLIATRSDGKTYVSWYEQGNLEVHLQLLDTNGYKLWSPQGIIVSNYPQTTSTSTSDLKVDNEGNAILAFQDVRTGGNTNVVAYKVDANGNLIWGTTGVQLIDPLSTSGIGPAIGIDANNYVYIAWNADSANTKWISCQHISPAGIIQWAEPYRIKDTVGTLEYSRAKLFPTGNTMQILYVEEAGSFPSAVSTLYTERFDSTGANVFPLPIKVSTKTIPYFFFPEPVPDDNGGFYVAFNTSNPVNAALSDVYVQYVDFNGTLWSATGTEAANSTSEFKTTTASCYVSSMSEFWVAIRVQDAGQSTSGIAVQKIDGSGASQLGANGQIIIAPSSTFYIPHTISDVHNGIVVGFGYGNFQETYYVAKVDYNGIAAWPGVKVPLSTVNSLKDDMQAGKFLNNNLVYVWSDDRNGTGVYAQNINGDGQPGITTSVRDNNFSNSFSIYPNPSDKLNIYFSDQTQKQITITDITGRIVYNEGISPSKSFSPTLNLKEGVYNITVIDKNGKYVGKWKKQ